MVVEKTADNEQFEIVILIIKYSSKIYKINII